MYFDVIFWHGVYHAPANGKPAPFLFLSCSRDLTDTMIRKKYKSDHNLYEKWNKKWGRLSDCLHMWFKYEVKISDRNSQNWAGHRRNSTCSHHYFLMYMNRFWVISLDGWRTGQCNRYRSSPCVFRTVYTKFTLIGDNDFSKLSLLHRKERQ